MRKMILGLAPAILMMGTAAQAAPPAWKVSEVSGRVQLSESGRSRAAVRGALLSSGATITTAPGARAVIVRGEEFVVISPNTRLRVPEAAEADGIMQIIEDFGTALFKIKKKSTPHFGVKTPYLAAVVKGTTFTVTVGAEGGTVQVTEGAVEVSTLDGGATDLVTPGAIAMVGASDLYRLSIEGDASKVLRSSEAPAQGNVTTGRVPAAAAAYAGPAASRIDITAPVGEAPKPLGEATGGLIGGGAAVELAVAEAADQSRGAQRFERGKDDNVPGGGNTNKPDDGKPDKDKPGEAKPDEPKPDKDKPEKPDEPKPDKDKPEEPKPDQPEEPKADLPEEPKADQPEEPKADEPKPDKDKPADPIADQPDEPKPDKDKPDESDKGDKGGSKDGDGKGDKGEDDAPAPGTAPVDGASGGSDAAPVTGGVDDSAGEGSGSTGAGSDGGDQDLSGDSGSDDSDSGSDSDESDSGSDDGDSGSDSGDSDSDSGSDDSGSGSDSGDSDSGSNDSDSGSDSDDGDSGSDDGDSGSDDSDSGSDDSGSGSDDSDSGSDSDGGSGDSGSGGSSGDSGGIDGGVSLPGTDLGDAIDDDDAGNDDNDDDAGDDDDDAGSDGLCLLGLVCLGGDDDGPGSRD